MFRGLADIMFFSENWKQIKASFIYSGSNKW